MADILITIFQAVQLVALGPCLFIIFFLFLTAKKLPNTAVPILYFISLSCSFILPLLPLFEMGKTSTVYAILLFGESLNPSFSFLLIMQFFMGRTPPYFYWLILALPVIGGSSFIYGTIYLDTVCIMGKTGCIDTESLKTLYNIFGVSLIFLLLIMHYTNSDKLVLQNDVKRGHKYWLIMSLIMLNLQLLVIDLAQLADMVKQQDSLFIATIIRVIFIYLVLTSLFRVFDRAVDLDMEKIPSLSPRGRKKMEEEPIAKVIEAAVVEGKLYREAGMNRETLARRVGVSEQMLSRVLNNHFNKNYNEFMNYYRVEDAKRRLLEEAETPITNIAFDVGFSSIPSFNRVFKDMTGQAPSEFRSTKKEG